MFLLLVQVFISLILAPILEHKLQRVLVERTEGLYHLRTVEIDWEFFNRKLLVSDVLLEVDTSHHRIVNEAIAQGKPFLRLAIPQMKMEWLDLIEIFQSNRIHLRSVDVFSPIVSVSSHQKKDIPSSASFPEDTLTSSNWYKRITSVLAGIYIDRFRISGGSFRLNDGNFSSKNSFVAHDIDVYIDEFRLDSLSTPNPDRPFFAKEISVEVGVQDYSYVLPDSSYNVQLGRLGVSTSKQLVYAEEVQLRPNFRKYRQRLQEGQQVSNLFELHIPRIDLEGLHINEVYDDRMLDLDAVRFRSPYLVQIGKVAPDSEQEEDLRAEQIFAGIAPYLHSIHAREILIEEGHIQRISEPGDTLRTLDLQGVELRLDGFRLDSSLQKPQRRMLFSDEIGLSLDQYRVRISDNNYQLNGGQLSLSTDAHHLLTSDIHLSPSPEVLQMAQVQGQDVIDLRIPKVAIQGIDLASIWYDRKVEVEHFLIQTPDIQLLNYPEVRKEQVDSLAQADLYGLISAHLTSVSVEKFEVVDGNFSLNTLPEPLRHEFVASGRSDSNPAVPAQ